MAYSVIPTVNPTDVIASSTWGNIVKADVEYMYNGRPGSVVKRDNAAQYTTTSTSFANIDGTNITATLTISSGKARVSFVGIVGDGANAVSMFFDFTVDGTRYGTAGQDGIAAGSVNTNYGTVGYSVVVTGLSVGSHTFVAQWRVPSGTGRMSAGGGSAAVNDGIPIFSVEEIG